MITAKVFGSKLGNMEKRCGGDINWLGEQQLRTTDLHVDDILLAAQNELYV
jgi:hypothetical protein